MKTLDVRIECSDQFQVFVHDVLLAVEKEYPVTAQIAVTELPPQVGEDKESSCCGRCWKNDGHCPHYKIGLHHCLYFIPAAPVAAPNCNLCKPPIDKENCAACNGIPVPIAPDEFNCPDCARVSDCEHFGYPENEKCFVQPAAPGAPAVDIKEQAKREIEAIDKSTPGWEKEGICAACNKPVNFKDGFIWNGKLNSPVHYGCSDVAPAVEKIKFKTGCEIVGCDEYDKINGICLHDGECKYRTPTPCPSCEKLKGENEELTMTIDKAAGILENALKVALSQTKE